MDIEILDKDQNVLLLIPNAKDPEYNFQFVWKELIPGAEDWRGYVPPAPSDEELLKDMRERRNKLLLATDWTQMNDSPLSAEDREKWKVYRQALRDMPETSINLLNPEWPVLGA